VVYITSGLVEVLLDFASERDPSSVTIALSVTAAVDLDPAVGLDPETPVYSHFYMPADDAVSRVFGVDMRTPPTEGRFVSHPEGNPELDRTDDLHAVVFVATPPWSAEHIRAYDRSGRRLPVETVDAAPPTEALAAPDE